VGGVVLDGSGRAILNVLQEDAVISNLELSQRIGLSPSGWRFRRLVQVQACYMVMGIEKRSVFVPVNEESMG